MGYQRRSLRVTLRHGSYDFFVEMLQHLDEEQSERFDATMKVNPEAAVLWILSMDMA